MLTISGIFIYKRKQINPNTPKEDQTDCWQYGEGQNMSTMELRSTQHEDHQPRSRNDIVTPLQNGEFSLIPADDVNNTFNSDQNRQVVMSLQIQLMGNPEMINQNRDIKDQVKVLPYNTKREIPRPAFEPTDVLGSGNFGTVYKGVLKGLYGPNSETQIAIKTISNCPGDNKITELLNEIKIMSYVNPQNGKVQEVTMIPCPCLNLTYKSLSY